MDNNREWEGKGHATHMCRTVGNSIPKVKDIACIIYRFPSIVHVCQTTTLSTKRGGLLGWVRLRVIIQIIIPLTFNLILPFLAAEFNAFQELSQAFGVRRIESTNRHRRSTSC